MLPHAVEHLLNNVCEKIPAVSCCGRDPLGRQPGSSGMSETGDSMLNDEDVYRRARDLLDEIRRRSGEGARSDIEREYLERLLDRF